MSRPTVLLDAPSNLGLRPPAPETVPGCHKAPWALRDQGLLDRLGARDAGAVVPPRYDRHGWNQGDGVFNAAAIAAYTRRLADRLEPRVAAGARVVVLGGDCSILLGAGLALRRRGRYGLAFLDGHSDFRHPGNATYVGAAAGEDLALVTGRGQADLVDLDGLGPYFPDTDVVALGMRAGDELLDELVALGIPHATAPAIAADPAGAARETLAHVDPAVRPELDGFWVHLDVDILDPSVMPAVDSPDPGGLAPADLTALLRPLLAAPGCVGLEVTVFDPDLDPDGRYAALLADLLVDALTPAS
jgi:arginase